MISSPEGIESARGSGQLDADVTHPSPCEMTRRRQGNKNNNITGGNQEFDDARITLTGTVGDMRGSRKSTDVTIFVSSEVNLRRQITLPHAMSILVGMIVGSGIFVSPVGVVKQVGSVGMSLVMWLICGIINALCALCYVELSASTLENGAEYAFVSRAFGELPGFVCLWTNCFFLLPIDIVASTMIFATYAIQPFYQNCEPPISSVRLIAASVLLLVVFVNCVSMTWAMKLQAAINASKVIAIALIIGIGFSQIAQGQTDNFDRLFSNTDYSAASIAMSFYSGFWAYSGWHSITFLVDEIIEPERNLPKAIIMSMCAIIVLYLFINMSYFAVLSASEMIQSSAAVAVTFANNSLPKITWLIQILIAVSVVSYINGNALATSRLLWIGARRGHLPSTLSLLSCRRSTPIVALICVLLLTFAMHTSNDIFFLIDLVGLASVSLYVASFASLLRLRITEPSLKRPIRMPIIIPIILAILCLCIIVLTIYRQPMTSLYVAIFIAASVPMFYVGKFAQRYTYDNKSYFFKFNSIIQSIFMVVQPSTCHGEGDSS